MGVNFQGPVALNKAATTALNKDKAVRAHKRRTVLSARTFCFLALADLGFVAELWVRS